MKAAVFHEVGKPVSVEDVSVRAPGEGEVLVAIRAAGLCHSDVSAINGTDPTPRPTVMGHEGAGIEFRHTHDDETTPGRERGKRLLDGLEVADRLEGVVHAASAGEVLDRQDRIDFPCVDDVGRAETTGPVEFGRHEVHGDDTVVEMHAGSIAARGYVWRRWL